MQWCSRRSQFFLLTADQTSDCWYPTTNSFLPIAAIWSTSPYDGGVLLLGSRTNQPSQSARAPVFIRELRDRPAYGGQISVFAGHRPALGRSRSPAPRPTAVGSDLGNGGRWNCPAWQAARSACAFRSSAWDFNRLGRGELHPALATCHPGWPVSRPSSPLATRSSASAMASAAPVWGLPSGVAPAPTPPLSPPSMGHEASCLCRPIK
jgi:hypothetical protein